MMRQTGILVALAGCIALSAFAQAVKPAATKTGTPAVSKAAPAPAAPATAAPKPVPKTDSNVGAKPATKSDTTAAKPDAAADAGQKALQALKDQEKKTTQAVELTREWLRRWNALDGKPASVDSLLELYRPDAIQEVGPNERQGNGAVVYEGQRLIRRWAENVNKQWSAIHYLIAYRTVKESTIELIQTGQTPWGATQVAVELTGGQTDTQKNKRFMLRGAAFFEMRDGKISRVRIYTPKDEMLEITGPRTATN